MKEEIKKKQKHRETQTPTYVFACTPPTPASNYNLYMHTNIANALHNIVLEILLKFIPSSVAFIRKQFQIMHTNILKDQDRAR